MWMRQIVRNVARRQMELVAELICKRDNIRTLTDEISKSAVKSDKGPTVS